MAQRTVSKEQIEAVAQGVAPLLAEGQVVEVRVLNVEGRSNRTDSGYFDNIQDLALWAASYSGRAEGVYITLNPTLPALLARSPNEMREFAKHTTSDSEILCRRWFPLDFDPKRPSGISSSEAEHDMALERAALAVEWLTGRGWPAPIFADSGNGAHLLYRVPDLPNSAEVTVWFQKALLAVAMTLSDGDVEVDTGVFNAARIWKAYGTRAAKGKNLPERPHRMARILSKPEQIQPITLQMLKDLAALLPEEEVIDRRNGRRSDFDLATWIAEHNLDVRKPASWGGGQKWIFNKCPWDPAHTDKSAYIVQFANGAIAAGCHHNSCQGHDWRDLREMHDGPAPARTRERVQDHFKPSQINRAEFNPLAYRAEDGGVLDAFCDLYSSQWHYATGWDAWLNWCGTHWRKDEALGINALIEILLDEMNQAAKKAAMDAQTELANLSKSEKEEATELAGEARQHQAMVTATKRSKNRIASVEGMAQHRLARHAREFNASNTLNLTNGTLDLETFGLKPHSQQDGITYVLDYEYDPAADCPTWQRYLRDVLVMEERDEDETVVALKPDETLIRLYQELWGYSLTVDTHHSVIVFQVGEGGNGKSVAIAVLNALLGDQLSVTLNFHKIGMPGPFAYAAAKIPGKRVLLSTESEKGKAIPEDMMKGIADGEPMMARAPYQSDFEFRPVGKIWWSMNHLPKVSDTTQSMWRRMKVIPFRRKFTPTPGTDKLAGVADVHLIDKLIKERPGILNWALEGLERLREQGRFTEAEAVTNEVNKYRKSSNPVQLWLEDRCDDTPSLWVGVPAKLYDDYLRWAENNGYTRDAIVNSREFAQELARLGKPSKKTGAGMRYPLMLRQSDTAKEEDDATPTTDFKSAAAAAGM